MNDTTKKVTKEVAVIPEAKNVQSVDSFIDKAIASNASVEVLERLFTLHTQVEDRNAKSAFVGALAEFQKECPVIQKTKKVNNKDGTLRYQYAPLDGIHEQIKSALSGAGLSYSWDVKNPDKMMEVTITLTHVQGHSVTSTLGIPIATEGFMTEPQKYASAQTYAKRYTLLNVLGITTADEDTDATDVNTEKDALSPKSKIIFNLRRLGYDTDDKTVIEETVKKITSLKLVEKNYSEIVDRLELSVKEKEEYENSEI